MSESRRLQQENLALLRTNESLHAQIADAKQALEALAAGEVDAVTIEGAPVLLRAAQDGLRRSEALLRAVFDSSLDAKLLANDEGRFVDVNTSACEMFGLHRDRLLGRSLSELGVTGYDAEADRRALAEHGRVRGVLFVERGDGARRTVEYNTIANVIPGLHFAVLRDVTERVATVEALRAHRSLLEEAQAIAHLGSWRSGLAPDDPLIWSAECYRIFGVPVATPLTVSAFIELVHPDDRGRVGRCIADAVARGERYEVDHRILRPDGEVRWVQERAVVEHDAAGRATGLVGTVQDVTDNRAAVEALRASEAEFRLLAEAMPQIVWITGADGRNIYFNQRWVDYTGLSVEENLGHTWLRAVHPDDNESALYEWRAATAASVGYAVECRLRRADGVYRWWLIRGEPVRDGAGTVLKWFGTCTDIETLKQGEAVLREKEALLRIAGHVARLGAWSLTVPQLEMTWSDEVCAIHEVPVGTTPTLAEALANYAPEFRAEIQSRVERCIGAGEPFDVELQIVTASKKRLWVRAIANAERDASGAVVMIRGAFQDIDDRRKLQEQLLQSQKMDAMGQLAGGVAHDFNNILAVILSYGAFIRDALAQGDQRRDDVLEVLKAAERAAGLTRQLLTFTRQQPTEKRAVDLNESLAQVHKLLVRTLGEHITLTVVPLARSPVVFIDPVQFDQILLNLAVNARDAMPNGGQLRIDLQLSSPAATAAADTGWVRLSVTDTGVGMDEQTQKRIFEPFFTTKEKGKGTGLGLATCFAIVADAGGKIGVTSALGAGTTFTVELPLHSGEANPVVTHAERVARTGRGETVLIAEDDATLRRVTSRVLRTAGYTVFVAADGNEAKQKLEELGARVDVVVSDVVMPGCGGHDVAAHAARVAPGAVVLLTSGFIDVESRKGPGSDLPVLWKPVAPQDLVRAVGEALRGRRTSMGPHTGSVLLAEDDGPASRAVARLLTSEGYRVDTVATVAAARQRIENGPEPLAVLCDLTLADGSAATLLDWLRETRPELCSRVFILTGGATDEAGNRVVDSGHFRVLAKPIHPKRLLEALAHHGAKNAPPAREPSPPRTAEARGWTQAPARKERVLVVDDDAALSRAIQRHLEGGFEVVVAGTVAEARTALDEGDFDGLVTDIDLPDGSGLDLLRDLRGKNSELPVVITTGSLSTEAAAQAFRSRVSAYLPKPIVPEDMLRTVRSAVDSGRVARLRTKLIANRFGGDDLVKDLAATEKSFALALPKIRMAFQPIVRSSDCSVYGYEALLRCDEPSLATPLRLFAAAEVLGRVDDVGRTVRANVAAVMRASSERLETIFVNVHPAEMLCDFLCDPTEPLSALAGRVVLEITERASLEGGPSLDAALAAIRKLGYRLAVDDLGEGYAGLSSLVLLRPDIAKIDMSLVRDIHRMPLKQDIVAALVDMARRSSIVVVAEGVETVEERDTLVDLGCDLLQGYLFAQPGPPFPVPRTTFEPA